MTLVDDTIASWQDQLAAGLSMALDLIDKTSAQTWNSEVKGHHYWHILLHGLAGIEYYFNDIDPTVKDLRTDFVFTSFGSKRVNPFLEGPIGDQISQSELKGYVYYLSNKIKRLLEDVDETLLVTPTRFVQMNMNRVQLFDYSIRHFITYLGQAIGYLRVKEGKSVPWIVKSSMPSE